MKLPMLFLVSLIAPCFAVDAQGSSCECLNVTKELSRLEEKINKKIESLTNLLNEQSDELNAIQEKFKVKDCSYAFGGVDGEFNLIPFDDQSKSVRAMCDMTTSPGGWTVIQRRYDGSVNFYRKWKDYKYGFGNPAGEYWIGLEAIHGLTKGGNYKLRIDLEDRENDSGYATYSTFVVGSEATNYRLQISGYAGNIRDSMTGNNGMMFSTLDQDHDEWRNNCGSTRKGGWWHKSCTASNLNGLYSVEDGRNGLTWYYWNSNWKTMKTTKMMIRPKV